MDFDRSLIDEFVAEAKEHLETIEDDFLDLEKQKDNPDYTLVDKVFRAIHSIKGGAGFIGLNNINDLSHNMETLLSMMRSGDIKPESRFIDTLLAGVDLLSTLLDDVENSNEIDISEIRDRLTALLAKEISPETKTELDTNVPLTNGGGRDLGFQVNEFTLRNITATKKYLYVLKYDLNILAQQQAKSPVALIKALLSTGEIVDARIETSGDDLRAGLPTGPLLYEVLYASIIEPDIIQLATGVSPDNIINVNLAGIQPAATARPAPAAPEPMTALVPLVPQAALVSAINDSSEKKQLTIRDEKILSGDVDRMPDLDTEGEDQEARPESVNGDRDADLAAAAKIKGERPGTIRITVDILDKLMMLAGELVLVRNQQLLAVDKTDPVARSVVQRLDIVTSELQESIMRTRMQPIGNVFGKFPRIVRELGKKLGKRIEITIYGNEVELDKTILESLADPLTHLIRNACDHGIEPPDVRAKSRKPETGHVVLRASHEAGQINIEIRDDGRGISADKVKKKILEKKLKGEVELAQLSEKEILSYILLPGFSTVEAVSDVSGRGVGMDVVKSSIEKLGGTLDLESRPGEGTAVLLRLPLTLAIIPCLIVMMGDYRYAIPQVNLEELVCLYDEDVVTKVEYAGDKEVFRLRDRLLPLVRLGEILKRPQPFTEDIRAEISESHRREYEQAYQEYLNVKKSGKDSEVYFSRSLNFCVLKVGANRFGLIIDRVIGTEEIVVKPMHPAVKSLSIYSGATVMGDGRVALILDIEGIAKHGGISLEGAAEEIIDQLDKGAGDQETQTVLLFKNGPEEQFAVALPLVKRVERVEAAKIERVGQREYVTIDGVSTLILRLHDHLNVNPTVEREEMFLLLPKHIKKPFGILMSSIIDIEETSIEMNTESYMEDGLLGTDILRGHMTLFIDIYRLIEKAEPEWFSERRLRTPPPEQVRRILLVEDASFFRHLVKGYLEADGYEVVMAENGQIGLDKFNEINFDLVVSDINMPVMDGWEMVRKIRSGLKNRDVSTIALTALDSDEDRDKAKKVGFNWYRTKIDRELLLTTVAEAMQKV
ncbi:MAG: chemotaxis protein CheW [Deltaproteobacteria bacterium]|nr:chemotaxis protein CheW [Deltaproteobacteria bacterium]